MNKRIIGILLFLSITFVGCNNVVKVNNKEKENTKITQESDLTESENYNGITTCEEAEELAKKEISEGKIKYMFNGFGSTQKLPKNLEKLYGIEIIKVGGVLGIPNKCYNDLMYREIQEKFGKDAFSKAME
jgi:hypothetical protein